MTTIPITTTFIAVYVIALVPMTGWVGLLRGKLDVLRGHGNDPVLEKRIRIHGNFVENAPAMAFVLGASELLGTAAWALWLAAISFFAGRFMHYVLYDAKSRAVAMSITQFPAALLAVWCLYSIYIA